MQAPATFPHADPVGPAFEPLSADVTGVIGSTVADRAEYTDRHGISRSALDHLAAAGLMGTALEPVARQRELTEVLAGSDASMWFCWAQHQTPMKVLEASEPSELAPHVHSLQEALLPGMRSGTTINAVAFAHVRRPGPANPVATRVRDGWVFSGTLDWVTSWDVADVVMVMAQGAAPYDDYLVCAYLPAGHSADVTPGLEPGDPLNLLAMSGTHTRPVALPDVFVPDERIGAALNRQDWLAIDAQRTAAPNPAAFGVVRAAIAELATIGEKRREPATQRRATELTAQCRLLREASYAAIDDVDREASRAVRLELRARSLDLAMLATTSVVIARAGASMMSGCSAERRVREALFLQVQAQTADTRAASLSLPTA